jgi:hypothetical protein
MTNYCSETYAVENFNQRHIKLVPLKGWPMNFAGLAKVASIGHFGGAEYSEY